MSKKESCPAQARVMQLLLTGGGYTTRGLSHFGKVSDPRKTISILREKGVPIFDEWEVNDEKIRYKRYYIATEYRWKALQWRSLRRK